VLVATWHWLARPCPLVAFTKISASMPNRRRRKPSNPCIFITSGSFAMYTTLRSSSQAFAKRLVCP
jgi:hypothetical protein